MLNATGGHERKAEGKVRDPKKKKKNKAVSNEDSLENKQKESVKLKNGKIKPNQFFEPMDVDLDVDSNDDCQRSPTKCILIKNLPQNVTYAVLNGICATAKRYKLYKKSGKRHAFANFSDVETCKQAFDVFSNSELDGNKLQVMYVDRRKNLDEQKPDCENLSLTIQNIPFSVTKEELEEEFPTAKSIVLNVNRDGRFKGSCALEFENADDARIVLEACKFKKIGDRPIRCLAGVQFKIEKADATPRNSEEKCNTFGLKLKSIPLSIDEGQLKELAVFQNDVVSFWSSPRPDLGTQSVLIQFRSYESCQSAYNYFRMNEFMEHKFDVKYMGSRKAHRQKLRMKRKQRTKNKSNKNKDNQTKVEKSDKSCEMTSKSNHLGETDKFKSKCETSKKRKFADHVVTSDVNTVSQPKKKKKESKMTINRLEKSDSNNGLIEKHELFANKNKGKHKHTKLSHSQSKKSTAINVEF